MIRLVGAGLPPPAALRREAPGTHENGVLPLAAKLRHGAATQGSYSTRTSMFSGSSRTNVVTAASTLLLSLPSNVTFVLYSGSNHLG